MYINTLEENIAEIEYIKKVEIDILISCLDTAITETARTSSHQQAGLRLRSNRQG